MTKHEFLRGMGMGMVAGAALGMAMAPKKRKMNLKKAAGRAIQTVGEAVENISDAMDM